MDCEEMDEEMEDVFQQRFHCFEVDLDYEFDASSFFDFTRPESIWEARAAELWFETAGSYPPSPFIAKLNLRGDEDTRNSNAFPKPNDMERSNSIPTHSDIDTELGFSVLNENEGSVFPDQISKGVCIAKAKSVFKASFFSSGSTLMKPTACQLARQNRPREIKGPRQFSQRLQKQLVKKSEKNIENPSRNEIQASKKQKLEGGQSFKVYDVKQQTNLIHKVPKMDQDGHVKGSTEQCRLKLTIPRGPELATSKRALRIRTKSTKDGEEQVVSAAPMFKACPLNKKILEAPTMRQPQKSTPHLPEFQEFNLKTSKRPMQHLSIAFSSLPHRYNSDNVVHKHKTSSVKQLDPVDTRRSGHQGLIPAQPQKEMLIDDLKHAENETIPKFKARPLNRKILSSKGDIGVFCTSKRETTRPREFNFMTAKRFQQNIPVELFDKLSLSEPKRNSVSQSAASQPIPRPMKNTKENMNGSLQQAHVHPVRPALKCHLQWLREADETIRTLNMTHHSTEKHQKLAVEQTQNGSGRIMTEITSQVNMFRSSGICQKES